jgi:hypothetical protein
LLRTACIMTWWLFQTSLATFLFSHSLNEILACLILSWQLLLWRFRLIKHNVLWRDITCRISWLRNRFLRPGVVAHACYLNYSRVGDQEEIQFEATQAKKVVRLHSNK